MCTEEHLSRKRVKTVGELLNALKEVAPETTLIYSTDDEGDNFYPVVFSPAHGYYINNTFITIEEFTELKKQEQDIVKSKGKKCVCIN